jgi:hypothetical protein
MGKDLTFRTGVNLEALLSGGPIAALGGAAGPGAHLGVHERIAHVRVPAWGLYVVAGVLIAIAIFAVVMGLNYTFCEVCNVATADGAADFPLELEEEVLEAVTVGDFAALLGLPMVPKNQMKMQIWGIDCPKCERIASVEVTRWQDYAPTTLMEAVEVTGPNAQALAALIQKPEGWRDSQDAG